jgi:NADH-quinone oxidoreductase subunit K
MTLDPLQLSLLISAALFSLGLVAVLCRSSAILALLGVELMLNAANMNFIAFWRYGQAAADAISPILLVIFSIAIAAAEAAVGLALVIAIYRHKQSIRLPEANQLKG